MGAGQHLGIVAVGIQGVFHDIVAGDMDNVHEQAAREFRQIEALAQLGTVDDDAPQAGGHLLGPLRQHPALVIEQTQPHARFLGAVAMPVIAGHETGMVTGLVAEQGEICGEIEWVEIAPGVGEHLVRQAHAVERYHLGTFRDKVLDLLYRTLGIEGRHQQCLGLALRHARNRLGGLTEQGAANLLDTLHEHRLDVHAIEAVEIGKGLGVTQRVVDRDGAGCTQGGDQSPALVGGLGVSQCLEEGVAPGNIAEGGDIEAHDGIPGFGEWILKNDWANYCTSSGTLPPATCISQGTMAQ